MTMPEEVNRLVADRISDLLLTPDQISSENLRKEGVPDKKIKFTGNIMIDTLEKNRMKADNLDINEIIRVNSVNGSGTDSANSLGKGFAVMTLHRPSNVDIKDVFEPIVRFVIDEVCNEIPVIWTIHPRTRKMLSSFGLLDEIMAHKNLFVLEPLGYLEMLKLNMHARVILTDSGGLQEECTVLGTPCLTLRWNTERPVTLIEHGGASVLVGNNVKLIRDEYRLAMKKVRNPVRPELWDGHSAERCLKAIIDFDNENSK
jgi:UDP-N-acetylglucosamine 2-epimerase (non-hydrolysing)